MLNDGDINQRILQQRMLQNHNPDLVVNCAYTLRVGAIFEPKSGAREAKPPHSTCGKENLFWTVGPTECLVVRTKEILNIPKDICAYYHPLQRLAAQGLLLINASIVESGYTGPLSCFLVNFSSQDIAISANQEIAKLTFHRLSNQPEKLREMITSVPDYERKLSLSARIFERSFLGIKSIEERAAKSAKKQIRKSLLVGGFAVGMLVVFAQLEPLFSKWIWEKSGVMTITQRTEQEKLLKDLEAARDKIQYLIDHSEKDSKIRDLEDKITKLQQQSARKSFSTHSSNADK